jgi:hypothetical protein
MKYQLLFYDRRHHLRDRFEFWAPNDTEACGVAQDLEGAPWKELWCGPRRLDNWRQVHASVGGRRLTQGRR